MSKVKIRSIEGVEEYKADRASACETCCNLIQVGDPTLLVVYRTDPKFKTGWEELDAINDECGSYLMHNHCEGCGKLFRATYNV